MRTSVIAIAGKANQVFKLIKLRAERDPNKTLGQLAKEKRKEE